MHPPPLSMGLGTFYAHLNLLTKTMQIFNADESGVNVICEVNRRGIHWVVATEKGRNHTVIACGSASGYALPPMIILLRVCVSEAPPCSIVAAQKKGWVTSN